MQYTYVEPESNNKNTSGWIHRRAWQKRKDGQGTGRAVMVHELHASNKELELLIGRCYDEARRTFFKVSNLPEAGLSTPCLERHFKDTREEGCVYCIVTNGWHGKTLASLFGTDGELKKHGAKLRKRLEESSQRRLFWQALTPITQLLRRMQEAKMFLPELSLDSLCFWAENESEFQEQEDGKFSFDSLRLIGLERIVPFGVRLRNEQVNTPTALSTPPMQILTWRTLAGVIIDTLFGAPPSVWPDEKKYEHRQSVTVEKMRNNRLSSDEYALISDMLHARDDFALGNVCPAFERLCHNLPVNTDALSQGPRLTLVYDANSAIPELVEGDDFDSLPSRAQVNAYLEHKLAGATVWFDPAELQSNKQMTLYFECGPGLWIKGASLKSRNTDQYNTSIIFLQYQTAPLFQYKKEGLAPVSLHNTSVRCFALQQHLHESHNGSDWVPVLEKRISHARYEKIKDRQLAVLSTLEMTNQLESLMSFLNLFVCRIDEVTSDQDNVTISLTPLDDSMLARVSAECMVRLTKVRQIQDDIRGIVSQTASYRAHMFRYLLDQHDQHVNLPEHQRRQEDLLITGWETAGSLSVNIGAGSTNLDKISWKVSDWDGFREQGRITVSRNAPLHAQEKKIICQGELVSVRTRGYYGQMEVIKRRTDAFEHLGKYDMLMQQLVDPGRRTSEFASDYGQFRTWAEKILYQDSPEAKKLDGNKMAIIEDAYNTMPLFVLQGPPGTGKSETVCSLAKLVFSEDPMVQILMTSRENATVKELLAKLHAESRHWPFRPIFRLSRKIQNSLLGRDGEEDDTAQSGFGMTVYDQVKELLDQAQQKQAKQYGDAQTEKICEPWNAFIAAHATVSAGAQNTHTEYNSEIEGISSLMEQSANFVFTTASDKGLADMVAEGYMYDWAFVEEAGKTPFYDLILPMLVSQRWFLLGDPQQLKPFQSREFTLLMENYTSVVDLLKGIKELGQSGRKDYVSLKNIERAIDRGDPRFFERSWIEPFRKMFEAIGSRELTRTEANGETSAMLSVVYRLPPVITELVSFFYKDARDIDLKPADLTRDTMGGQFAPSESKRTPLAGPEFLTGANAIWLNTQTRAEYCHEEKDRQVWNPGEAELIGRLLRQCQPFAGKRPSLAILTPYRKQVQELAKHLKPLGQSLSQRFTPAVRKGLKHGWVSTIDAFQGCQADVVILSLVRCRSSGQDEEKEKIGFIADENRANVMISRSQKLLLIIGSLDYFNACYDSAPDTLEDPFGKFLRRYQELASDSECREYLKIVNHDQVPTLREPLASSGMPTSFVSRGHKS